MTRTLIVVSMAIILLIAALFILLRQDSEEVPISTRIGEALSAPAEGYRRATEPVPFDFPSDHGPHNEFRLEWWYFTGNLRDTDDRHYGYQFTIFRNALMPPDDSRAADTLSWATNQLYLGHMAVTDVPNGAFYAYERVNRGAFGLAGAETSPLRVWVENWALQQIGGPSFSVRLTAEADDVAFDLDLSAEKPMVLQGDRGFSRKGPDPGQASYYYSFTRMATRGTLSIEDRQYMVEGSSWMDREWSTGLLGDSQVGWDWFSIQLDNGYDLMYFRLRERDPATPPYTDGVIVTPSGTTVALGTDDVVLAPVDDWTSPRSGATYPVAWRLEIPAYTIDLEIEAYVRDQELNVTVRYWEGTVRARGTFEDRSVSGSGYLEMTGYGDNKPIPSG